MFYRCSTPWGKLSQHQKEAMNILQCPWPLINKKTVGNPGAARGLSPYLGAGQWAGSSLFHHQHHHACEPPNVLIVPLSSADSITKRLKYVKENLSNNTAELLLPHLNLLFAVDPIPGLEDQIKGGDH